MVFEKDTITIAEKLCHSKDVGYAIFKGVQTAREVGLVGRVLSFAGNGLGVEREGLVAFYRNRRLQAEAVSNGVECGKDLQGPVSLSILDAGTSGMKSQGLEHVLGDLKPACCVVGCAKHVQHEKIVTWRSFQVVP